MLSPAEVAIQRMLTEAFIAADANDVVLEPFSRESNGSGGYRKISQPPRAPQVMRLVPISTTSFERMTLDGRTVSPQFVLLGQWNSLMDRGDKFSLLGKRYEVVHVQEKSEYIRKGESVLLGDA